MSHHLLYLLILSIFFIDLSAQSNDSTYPTCPSSMCNGVNISYPFWRIDNELNSHFCGYQGFGINCSTIGGDPVVPEFNLSGNYYKVQNISYYHPYKSIILSAPVDQRPNDCPRVRNNITLGTLPLVPMMSTVNISFHFNCTGFPSFATELRCLGNNERKSCIHVMNDTTEATDWDQYSCSEEVITTVFKDPMGNSPDLTRGFVELLRRGFELEWISMDDDHCEKCEQSDGRCGQQDTRGFICFCSDGTITRNYCK
ncbi:LEAF RUST 10 DISEASE-RESISTANCE LOCUS RECEPTOR-LIKE PROTEIN KINASE-like 1.2, partial [Bidens hawaiensis]|uniref:LEAF RUST 10 DISEASE-RESISTANCE LOCUS RECEPTOR-LIKE PROTEIN KINASE-like 1.2 n=1 Tax=Bidens hawaiensis TaxID=980011 RepID=UPI00404A0184